jgi:hypothetical protein
LHISRFLGEVVPKDALRHIRILELVVFEDLKGDRLSEWKRTIAEIKPHLLSSHLALKLFFAAGPPSFYDPYREPSKEEIRASQDELLKSRRYYFDAALPLQQLSYHLKYLWICVFEDPEERREGAVWTEWSCELESTIMGSSYKPPTIGDYDLDELSMPLILRTGRWYSDHECGSCFH